MENLEKVFAKIMSSDKLKAGLAKAMKNNTVQAFMKKLGVDEPADKILAFLKDKKFDADTVSKATGILAKIKSFFSKKK